MSELMLYRPPVTLQAGDKRSDDQLRKTLERIRHARGEVVVQPIKQDTMTFVERLLVAGLPQPQEVRALVKSKIKNIRKARHRAKQQRELNVRTATIVAFVPTYEAEDKINETIEALLLQSRTIDKIVICVNGPGKSTVAYDAAMEYSRVFGASGWLEVIRPEGLAGKVNALNFMFARYARSGLYDFILGVDADVIPDEEMGLHLAQELVREKRAGGVMARYSFEYPSHEEMKMEKSSRHLINGQRHEFASVGINQQLRSYTSNILGGQATLFRCDVLMKIAKRTVSGEHDGPWDINSKVEDAKLTREIQREGMLAKTSKHARAWTGLMHSPHTWQQQRRKWQDGHLEDMMRDFHPILDRRRWFEQMTLGWNLIIRVMFAALLTTSISLDRFVFNPLWLIPVGLAVLQSFLVAIKIPKRRLVEIVRSLLFIPTEVYYVRTLSIWLDSMIVMFLNVKRDGWKRQADAEASKKRSALSVWLIIALAVAAPSLAFIVVSKALSGQIVDDLLSWSWTLLSIMTALSVIGMAWKILRILRHYRTLAP